ncbi:hypothetical protein M6D81_30570 [Paenibacillus sp. J5C_2022]|uniref:hypothetical protein n=1 Tax=Paenibacillus sp. J5C2022 TaxID=2977129 RepID=UPI0021CE8C20|nr:hypothetical protein [Paenibacillus sp. J5C2022]MCU6713052.1 hypothetical protein [Paenibacillus sp. J5C2022]
MPNIKWQELKSQKDLNELMKLFGWFHDSCIKEMHMWTDHNVNPDLSMSLSVVRDNRVRILIHRQYKDPTAIELLFEEVTQIYISPSPENHDSIIYEATFIYQDGNYYWADDRNWEPEGQNKFASVNWISSKKVSWRDASDWIGKTIRYGSPEG